jgi:hypothetical protein
MHFAARASRLGLTNARKETGSRRLFAAAVVAVRTRLARMIIIEMEGGGSVSGAAGEGKEKRKC